jgi:methylmalonyl-CoA mutase
VIRATKEEKDAQIQTVQNLHKSNKDAAQQLKTLQTAAIKNQNTFEALIEAGKNCTLGQITEALYQVGGKYRRNM